MFLTKYRKITVASIFLVLLIIVIYWLLNTNLVTLVINITVKLTELLLALIILSPLVAGVIVLLVLVLLGREVYNYIRS